MKAKMLFLLLFCGILIHQAMAVKQSVELTDVGMVIKPHDGARCVQIRYVPKFKYSGAQKLAAKDSSYDDYTLMITLQTDNGFVKMRKCYAAMNEASQIATFKSYSFIDDWDRSVFFPIAALQLDTGLHKLRVAFQFYDHDSRPIGGQIFSDYFDFHMLPVQPVRIMIHDIAVSQLNTEGNTWDFAFLGGHKTMPDVFWQIEYGGYNAYHSATQWDTYEWQDSYGNNDVTFYIVKGDIFTIAVMDEDNWSFNDVIGRLTVNTSRPNTNDMGIQGAKFNCVLRMVYELSTVPNVQSKVFPKATMQEFQTTYPADVTY